MTSWEGAVPTERSDPEPKTAAVRVRIVEELRARFGASTMVIEVPAGSTARDALHLIERRHPDTEASLAPPLVAFLNGRNIDVLSPEASTLQAEDELLLTNPIGGG